jgi:hypothetical protein
MATYPFFVLRAAGAIGTRSVVFLQPCIPLEIPVLINPEKNTLPGIALLKRGQSGK